jgi:hypothetical protein
MTLTIDSRRPRPVDDEHPLVARDHRDEITTETHYTTLPACSTQKCEITISCGNDDVPETIQISDIRCTTRQR